jgi:hypothetical protein
MSFELYDYQHLAWARLSAKNVPRGLQRAAGLALDHPDPKWIFKVHRQRNSFHEFLSFR